ncbi:MAG: transposase [Candidatus Accumulibacter sp.]|uniref:Transposase n=1 Tax=Candidatus Accumulibacter proximus TaxID=2954385 RepID=A0A935PYD1_9PROT|nr:transposase [Candidatus Accumulibacter proximus]
MVAKQPPAARSRSSNTWVAIPIRVAISNERLVRIDETTVRFRVRATPGKRVLSVSAEEFIDRFLLHVLPSGFKRIRHYGLLAPAAKATKLSLARQALSVPEPDPVITATVEDFLQRVGRGEWARCTHCHEGRFVPTAAIPPLRQATPQSASVSRTPMKTASAWRVPFPCALWQFRPPGDASSAACRRHGCRAALGLPERPVRSCHALANSRKPARLPLAKPSNPCPRLDPRRGTLIPISTAVEALQSNEVYLPRIRQRLGRVLSARPINAIR